MKLTTIMYTDETYHDCVNRKALRVRNSFFRLSLIASLLKLILNTGQHFGEYSMKNHPK